MIERIAVSDEQVLSFAPIARLLALFGVVGGFVSAVAYVVSNLSTVGAFDAVLVFVAAPLAQAIILLIYGTIGYPAYYYLARKGWLGFDRIRQRNASGDEM